MAALALLLAALLALSAHAVLEVQVPEMPVVALYGQDAVLNCSFAPTGPFNLSDLSIFWQLTDTKRTVYSYWDGRDQLTDQVEGFANRTGLFHAELGSGNASLALRSVRIADDGSFTCFVRIEEYGSAAVLVQVAAPYSKPQVTSEPESNVRPGDVVTLSCMAHGGYPEAQVMWLDGGGRNLTDNVTVSQVANEEGLFSMRSVLTVMAEPNSMYNCTLVNPLLGAEGHASASITAPSVTGLNMVFPPVALWVTVGLAICLLGLLIALAVICGRKIKESCEEADKGEEGKELEEDESKTAMTPLKS
ncbi:hypothetical protein SKAU_G00353320 [Synaphobranchus kaupii]|uniref:Ig-like domain-containing protein n=1 Tax=Synaphobranchus kaupii TaxID=118154 RepID=A0A9Q1EKU3_SYNKA|nr:hypothetical protein SKAU_G00353320 [Synaphobranchus kaupii]